MLKTGDDPHAGTTAQVFVRLIGQTKIDTGHIKLQLAKNKHFKSGSTETFIVQSIDVDELKQIEVYNRGLHSVLNVTRSLSRQFP